MKLYVKPGRRYRYGGKEYGAGEEVAGVPEKFVSILTHSKGPLEQRDGSPANPTDLPPPPNVSPSDDDLSVLRTRYAEVAGKRPFHGWDAAILKQKIAEYQTTNQGNSPNTTHLTAG